MTHDAWEIELEARAEAAAKEFKNFVKTIAQLRHPTKGCPWDLEQTHESLRRYMIEEAYEAAETMLPSASAHDRTDELGDVLLQVVLNAQLQSDNKEGQITDVIRAINEKMIRRHPHVFAPGDKSVSSDQVIEQWAIIKQKEKSKDHKDGFFHKAKKVHPALTQAFQIGKTAQKIDFDWHTTEEVAQQFESEWKELAHEMHTGDRSKIADELSDCFFSLAQLSRHLGFEPEDIAQRGNTKFIQRFELMEKIAKEQNHNIESLGQAGLELLWKEAKKRQKS
ncbi:MAG: nucleoside triphosphate pyrophosphohydrolase [Proteobacteria bacterium]|nr:MAG: nucleoside triphosphate pyrophosphohydrolase [Pseudomonadota bacterium]